jgi:Protein of unknown function, DUF547
MLLEVKPMAVALASSLLAVPAGAQTFDHSRFDELLKKHVVKGMVDYEAFVQAGSFKDYLQSLEHADPARLDDRERLAFWINAYNAYTIALINKYEERGSIRNIAQGIGFERAKGAWKQPVVQVGGKTYTLDEVENAIVRKQFREPRIHFALVCAAMSCPPLRSEAYTGAKLDAQLDSQARSFILDEARGSWVDVKKAVVHASRIFDWYKDDFGGSDAAVGRFIAQYHGDSPEKQLLLDGHFKMEYLDYDWTLNSRYLARLKG